MQAERYAVSTEQVLEECPSVNAHKKWIFICEQVHNVALDMLDKRHENVPDWFEAGVEANNPRVPSQLRLRSYSLFSRGLWKFQKGSFTFEQPTFRLFLDLSKS